MVDPKGLFQPPASWRPGKAGLYGELPTV